MRPAHVRIPTQTRRRSFLLKVASGTAMLLLIAMFIVGRLGSGCSRGNQITAKGTILETQIVTDHATEGKYGGQILYRLDARVTYALHGHNNDRWMMTSKESTSRIELEMLQAQQPQTCAVYWPVQRPDSPRCRLE